jgi:hypothetical protein
VARRIADALGMSKGRRRGVYRSREWAIGLALTGAGVVVGLLARLVEASALSPAERAGSLGVIGALSYFLLWRVAGSSIRLRHRGIVVVNPLTTRRIPWEAIHRFDVEPWITMPGVGTVYLRNGRAVRVFGIQAPHPFFRPRDTHAYDLADELNALLADRLFPESRRWASGEA